MSRMKHLLRKLHIGGSVNDHQRLQESRHNSPSPSSTTTTTSSSGPSSTSSSSVASPAVPSAPRARPGADSATETRRNGGDESVDFNFFEEEFQVQLALAISASDPDATKDPESVQIDAAKRISLGCSAGTSADALVDFLSLRYWNYNVVNYDEKVADGFYDVYGIISNANLHGKMPSLVDLQAISISDSVDYEVVLVNRTVDPELQQLERKADSIAVECQAAELGPLMSGLVQKIADLVVDSMGGPVGDADEMLRRWTARSYELRTSLNTIVLPLGCLRVGLSRHRALLFKVLADQINLPCRLVKGSYYTGTDEGAVNLIKIDQQSEYIIDLMGAPGTLIPAEMPSGNLGISAHDVMNSSAIAQTVKDLCVALDKKVNCEHEKSTGRLEGSSCEPSYVTKGAGSGLSEASGNDRNLAERNQTARFEHEFGKLLPSLGRPPRGGSSGTKEISSPAQKMKVKDVSKYVISAAQNPEFAQKLHAVLLESGASPPPDLFSDINSPQDLADAKVVRQTYFTESNMDKESRIEHSLVPFTGLKSSSLLDCENKRKRRANEMTQNQGFEKSSPNSSSIDNPSFGNSDTRFPADHRSTSPITSLPFTCSIEWLPHGGPKYLGVTDSTPIVDSSFVIPREYGQHARETFMHGTAENAGKNPKYPELKETDCSQTCQESINESIGKPVEIDNDRQLVASGSCTDRMDPLLDDVAEWEIPWEDLQLGERIGLGSFGEVYRADWNGTEVAVKKFLDQDFSGDALEQFRCEIKIMLRLRHPNVVLFMGAVTRPPNLSILTEFLPRGSLYRLLHRPNIQLDEKRRLRMALDVAKGMNYLHTSHPTIVHRDLKSPNLLVDKNWVVKVCDFGLSRLKHHTFLSSKSTAGTPEWMAPEVLRNEPSNEKCDVYSFGVILWELTTLRMPWSGMNPMQVVGAVGFQNRRLDIPNEVDPGVAQIISDCWQSDPTLRPSFAQLMAPLKHLRRLVVEVT